MADINLNEDKYEINIEEDALEIKLTEFLSTGDGGSNDKRDVDDYKFGTVDDNTEFDPDGTMHLSGSATVWDDIAGSMIGKKLFENKGTVDFDYTENTLKFSQNGDINKDDDCVIWNYQYPHKAKSTGELRMHMHYEQAGIIDYEFTMRYRIQQVGELKNLNWEEVIISTTANNKLPYVSGILNQIATLINIDMTGYNISSQIQFRMTRSDSNGGDVHATFVDGHYEIDSLGSDEEFIK
jgi:hypothetical protein